MIIFNIIIEVLSLCTTAIQSFTDIDGYDSLSWCCILNNIEALEIIMKSTTEIDYTKTSKRGESYLSLACYWNHEEIVKLLLDSALVDINSGLILSFFFS